MSAAACLAVVVWRGTSRIMVWIVYGDAALPIVPYVLS